MKICLIGSAPSSIGLAPYADKSYDQFLAGKPQPQFPPSEFIGDDWQLWACSPGAFGQIGRCNAFFELHRWEPGKPWFSPEYCQFLREFRGPVYTGGEVPEIKNHVVYPIDAVETEFSSYFLTSSLAMMCAVAILEIEAARKEPGHNDEDDVIAFFGVDMSATEEWNEQRPGCHYFILQAIERGIGIYVPPESDLLRPMPVYGLSEWDHNYIKLTARAREFNQRMTGYQQQINDGQTGLMHLRGAMDDLNYMTKTWVSPYGLPSGQVIRKRPELVKPHLVVDRPIRGTDGMFGPSPVDCTVQPSPTESPPLPGSVKYLRNE